MARTKASVLKVQKTRNTQNKSKLIPESSSESRNKVLSGLVEKVLAKSSNAESHEDDEIWFEDVDSSPRPPQESVLIEPEPITVAVSKAKSTKKVKKSLLQQLEEAKSQAKVYKKLYIELKAKYEEEKKFKLKYLETKLKLDEILEKHEVFTLTVINFFKNKLKLRTNKKKISAER